MASPRQRLEIMIKAKPLSANEMNQPTRGKGKARVVNTAKYKRYKQLIAKEVQDQGFHSAHGDKYQLDLIVGYSNVTSDLDNAFKPLLDSLQLALGFNDNQVYQINALKDITPVGKEYLCIRMTTITDNMWDRRIAQLFDGFINSIKKRWRPQRLKGSKQ